MARWLVEVIDAAIEATYVTDLLEDGVVTVRDLADPNDTLIARLTKEAKEQRRLHYRFTRSRDHKGALSEIVGSEQWPVRARTHLFRSKRALALATYLRCRAVLKKIFGA